MRIMDMQRQELLKASQWERVKQQIANRKTLRTKRQFTLELVEALAQAHEWEQAQAIIDATQENLAEVHSVLARELVKAQQWERAYEVIDAIEDNTLYEEVLYVLALEHIQIQQWEEAERVIDLLETNILQIKARCQLGIAYARIQDENQAKAAWEKVEALINPSQKQHMYNRTLLLLHENALHAHEEEAEEASFVLQMKLMKQVINTVHSGQTKARIARELAGALAQAQRFEQAREIIGTIQVSETRVEALLELGECQARAGHWDAAVAVLDEAHLLISAVPDSSMQSRLWSALAVTHAQARQWERARQYIAMMQQGPECVQALSKLGSALYKAQQKEEAEEAWMEALVIAAALEDNEEKDQALCVIVRALAMARQWQHAEIVLHDIHRDNLKAVAASKLGEVWMLAGDRAKAEQIWLETEQFIRRIHIDGSRDQALRALSSALVNAEQWEYAARIVAMIQSGILRTRSLAELGSALWKAQQWKQAEEVWLYAEEAIDMLEESSDRVRALIELGGGLARVQRWEQAQHIWRAVEDEFQDEDEFQGEQEFVKEEVMSLEQPDIPIAVKVKRLRKRKANRRSKQPRKLALLKRQAKELGIDVDVLQQQAETLGVPVQELLQSKLNGDVSGNVRVAQQEITAHGMEE